MKGGIYMAIFCFVLFLIINLCFGNVMCVFASTDESIEVSQQANLSMYSKSYALLDADTGRLLVGKEEDNPMSNASTTKILTCIVALENCDLQDVATVSANAASQPRVRLGMKEDEQYLLKDMLYGLMLESYNDCAVVIAEHVAGSVEAFAEMMNKKASEIGCKDTYFITPNGLDAEDETGFHHTTAADLGRIMAYCTWESPKKQIFLEITQTRNYEGAANGKTYSFVNRNSFLNQMEGAVSGKTGFTNKAGYCYVAALEKDNERYCIALLACGWPNNKTYKWKDAKTLFEYGLENYDRKKVIVKCIEQEIQVNGCVGKPKFKQINQKDTLKLYAPKKEYQLLMQETDAIDTEIVLYTDTDLPIKEGEKLGVCNLYLDNILIDSIPLKAGQNVYIWGLKEAIYTIFYQFLTFSL